MAQEPAWLSQSSKVDSDSWLDQVSKPVDPSQAKKDLPLIDITDIASSLGETVTSLPTTVTSSLGQMYEGTMNPWEKGAASIERQKEMRDVQREAEKAQAEAEASGEASVFSRAIRSGIPSYGFTGAIVPPSLVAGGVASLATAAATRNPAATQRAGMAAGTAASGYAAYRMAASQFLDDARERIDNFFLEKAGRLPNKQEQDEAYQELLPLAQEMGLAEALPEAFGNLALAGAGKYIYRILGGKTGVQQLANGALSKVKGMGMATGAGVAATTTEVGTEALTGVLQKSPQEKLEEGIMRGQPVESVQTTPLTAQSFGESLAEVTEPTLATTALFGLAGAGIGMGVRRATREDFSQDEFRDKLNKDVETIQRSILDPNLTEGQKTNLTQRLDEAQAGIKALDEGRSQDVESYFNVRFVQPMVNPAIREAENLNQVPGTNPDAGKSAQAAQEEINKAKAEAARLAAEKAAEAARIAEEQRKAAEKAPTPTPISIADSPSPNLLPRATENVEPKPIRNAGESREDFITRRDAWDEQYGGMRKGGRTHNDDGTPYQPTVYDEVAPAILAARQQMTDDEANERIGESSETRIATSVKTLLDAGWTWDTENQRWQQPENNPVPNESPLAAILRLQGKTQNVAPSTAPTATQAAPATAPAPKQSAAEKALGLPAGTLAPSATPPSPQTGQAAAPAVGKPLPDQLATVEEPWQIKGREWVKKQQANLGKRASDLDRTMNQNVDSVISSGQSFFGSLVDNEGNVDDGRMSAYREIFRSKGKDLVLEKPIGNLDKWKKSGVKNFPVVDFTQPQTPSPEMEMPSPPQGVDTALAPLSPIINEAPTQPPKTPTNAAPEIPLKESLRQEPQDRVEVRTPEETVAGDSLLRSKEGKVEEEVDLKAGLPRQQPGEAPDIITWLKENYARKPIVFVPKAKRRKATAEAEALGILDELPLPVKRRLFSFDYGEGTNVANMDEIAGLAYEANLIPSSDPTVLAQSIIEAFKARKAGTSLIKEGEQQMETAEQRTIEFYKSASDRTAPLTLIPRRDLDIGDVVQVGDDKMRVTYEYDEDGYPTVLILTGPKFGEQRFDPNKPLKAENTSNASDLKAVNNNTASQDQIDALVNRGFVEIYKGSPVITDVGVEQMPKKPKLTADQRKAQIDAEQAAPAERAAEVEGMGVPVAEPIVAEPIVAEPIVAEKPSPAPLREGAGVTGVAQTEPPRGSILEVEKDSLETETLSTPQSLAQSKEDAKQQKKDSDENLKALNSLEAGTKTNPVFGTVTREDASEAMRLIEDGKELPNVFFTVVTTREEFLADPRNEQLYPQVWNALKTNKKIEGLFDDATNTPFVFTDGVVVYDLDRKAAQELGISPQVAAVRRVLRHENIHKGMLHLTPSEMVAMRRFLATIFSEEALDNLAKTYTKYANWRSDPRLYFQAIEEIVNQKLDQSTVLPKDGIWGQFFELLTAIWRRITGKRNQPTVKDMKDVMRLVRNGLIRSAKAQADQTKDGGNVMLSIRAYHGTRHRVGKFLLSKIGTGEGAQAYGWGLYFAEQKNVADSYRKNLTERDFINKVREVFSEFDSYDDAVTALNELDLSEGQRRLVEALRKEDWWGFDYPHQAVQAAIREPQNFDAGPEVIDALKSFGNLYTVELLPDEGDFLDWDKPLSEQSEKVKNILSPIVEELIQRQIKKLEDTPSIAALYLSKKKLRSYAEEFLAPNLASGMGLYDLVRGLEGNKRGGITPDDMSRIASEYLASIGIPGIRYLDEGSRNRNQWIVRHPQGGENVFSDKASAQAYQKRNPEETLIPPQQTRNYVIFDENLVKILEENGQVLTTPTDQTKDGGSVMMSMAALEMDAEYLAAVEAGDMEKAQRMVDEAAKRAEYLPHGDFRDSHRAPSNQLGTDEDVRNGDADASLIQVARGVHNQPPDYFDPRVGPRFYSYQDKAGMEAFQAVRAAIDKIQRGRKALVTVYRAVPIDIKGTRLENRDWVTPSKTYAVNHGESRFGAGEYRILKESVPAENLFWDGNDIREWGKDDAQNYFYKNTANNIKSADPVTRDDNGNIIPLSQRFQPTSPDIRFSLPIVHSSESEASYANGQMAASMVTFTPRQMDVYSALEGAYNMSRKPGRHSVPLSELYQAALEALPDMTQQEFSEAVQTMYQNNSALLNAGESDFSVVNKDGDRVSSVVFLGKGTMASMIPSSEVPEIASKLASDLKASVTEGEQTPYEGLSFTGVTPKTHARVDYRGVRKSAEDFVNQMIRAQKAKGKSYADALIEVANTITNPSFANEYMADSGTEEKLLATQAIAGPLNAKIYSALLTTKDDVTRIKLNDAYTNVSTYYEGSGTIGGTVMGYRAWESTNGKYGWMLDSWKADALKNAEDAINSQMGGSVSIQIGESLRRSVEGVSDSTANEVESQAQEDRDAALFREGQEALSGEDKNTFESIKSFLKTKAIINRRKLIRAGNQAMASIVSDEEYNAIMAMSDEEANALEKEIDAKLSAALKKLNSSLSGREDVKAKVDAAINVATDRANKGEDITFTQVTIEEAMADLFKTGDDTREKIVDNVADALLKRAKQAMAKPSKISSIQQLIASIKRTLLANIKVDKTTDADSLGRMLAMTFAQQISEARVYASSWSEGRKKVREMLAEIGIEESELDSELNKIMPPTPTLAFSPSAAKRAIALAMEESGVSRENLLDPRPEISKQAKDKLMAHLDKAAANENLTEQGWNKTGNTGRQLAEKAIDEAIAKWRIEQQNRLEISNLVAEQADNPVSMDDFAKKLSKFNLTPKQVKKYFDIAARVAVRSVEMRKDQARRIIYTRGDIRPDAIEKEVDGDTVIDAFTDQVSSPTDLKTFVERLDKLGVTFDLAESLFNTAARERRDRQRTRVFDMIEGPRALQKMLDEIRNVRAGLEVPLRSPIPWKELLSKPAKSVAEYRQKVLDAIMANPDLASVDSEVKERLADMFADVWQQQLDKVVNQIIDNYTQQLDRAKRRHAGDVLNKTRLQVIQHLNLNALSNDAFTRILGEKFGIKMELTEAERENIQRLVDIQQDETLPKNKRNQAANDLAFALVNDTKVGWSERLSAFWTSSVLAGWNTMIAIGLAFLNGANIIMVNLPMKIMSNLINGDFKGAFYSTFDSLNDIKRYIEAFPEALERSWHYLNTGRVEFLESEASAPDRIFRGWADVLRYRKVAEAMANDPKKVTQWMGKFSVMISRMMTALDGFNTILTKRGKLSMAVRLTAKSPEDHQRILEKASLEHYRQQILASDPYFAQMNSEKRALLNATAEAMMYEAMNKEGAKLENADFFASESAMTMNPTGIGGIVYNKIRSADVEVQEFMRRKLAEQKLKAAVAGPMSLENAKLAGMFVAHFIAYNAINMIGLRFARFASNKFNQGLSFIPFVGILRGWEASNNQLADRKEAFYDMIKRNQMVGMFFVGAGSILLRAIADEPDDEKRGFFINGGLKNVPTDKRRQLQESGKLEYRLGAKIGGKWYVWNYQNSPYSQLFAAVGAISDIIRFSPDKWNEKSKLDVALSVAASGLSSTLDLPALQGLGTLMGRSVSSSDPTEQFWENISATTANWVGGFIPKPFMDVDYILDDNRRKYTTIWEKFAGKVPFYRRYVGEDYYNILGDPIKANTLPGSREFLVGKTEPVYQILGALNSRNIWLTPANAEYRMVGKGRNRRRLTQEEADAYSFETGKGYKAMILRYGPRALQMDPERAKAFLHDKADQIRDRALKKVYRGYRSRTATP